MKQKYSQLLGILTVCYSSLAIAEQIVSRQLEYERPVVISNTTDSIFDTDNSIFDIKETPRVENQTTISVNLQQQSTSPVVLLDTKIENSPSPIAPPEQTQILSNDNQKGIQSLAINPDIFTPSSSRIANVLNSNNIEWQGLNNRLKSPDKVKNFYGQLNYQLLWSSNGRVSNLAEQVIHAIGNAPKHALRSELYHSHAFSSLKAGQSISEPEKFDVILSDAFITYKSHLANGIVNPKAQFPNWNKDPTFVDFVSLYLNTQSTGNIANIFTVNDPDYQVLQAAYLKEKSVIDTSNFVRIPAKSLRPGAQGKAVQVLRQRLGLDNSIDIYDEELKQAVKEYQRSKGLTTDGYAGKKTIRLLNRSPESRLQTLAINMERHRWGYVPNETYLQVNIPAYKMAIRNGKQRLFESNVIVGKTKRPTPIFSDVLETVVLAPYWNVPKTIFKEDKLPKLQRDPNHFGASMQVIDKSTGKVVNAADVDWASGGTGYRLRQKPGARNALGRMKFLFPNRHAIYLHDTNNRRLFKRSRRAFSSGCIRVERAEDLAVFLLQDKNYDTKRVRKESRGKEKWVRLPDEKRYPVFLDYYTAWVDSDDVVHYSRDIYGHDKQLKALYKKAINTQ